LGVILNEEFLKVRRSSELEITDRAILNEILDAGKVAHVGLVDPSGQPLVIPMAYVRAEQQLLLHGSTGSRLFSLLAAGAKICVTVTILDGIVAARSAFHHSMNYRSVMVFGTAKVLTDQEKHSALEIFTNQLLPNRWQEVRPMTAKEAAATMIVAITLDQMSGKARTGGPADEPGSDLNLPIWAGHIPIELTYGEPVPATGLPNSIPLPKSIASLNE
jgi:uncharacterized protein